jgi:VCBS repeat-containing protein
MLRHCLPWEWSNGNSVTATATATALGATAPWLDGAKVLLTAPDLSTAINPVAASAAFPWATGQYVPQALRFTLSTVPERALTGGAAPVGLASAAPLIYRPVFTSSQAGWTLQAHTDANTLADGFAPEALQRQGTRLYTQSGASLTSGAGLPWVPDSYTLTGPDGTRYQLDAQGQLTSVQFADGVQWLVSDAGIALVEQGNGLPTQQRLDFARDAQGRLVRVSTKSAERTAQNAALVESTIAYKYDTQGRLLLSRTINSTGTGKPYGYDNAGKVLPDAITANLGAATSWISAPTANAWTGSLQAGQTTSIAFAVRESEISSTVKTPGAQGAVIIALQTELADPLATVEVTGATVLGTTTVNGKRTTLLRVTEAGLKLIRIQGTGTATLSISIAGDLNQDGKVNGLDSQAWAQGAVANAIGVDINGDGQVTAADRQVLYANYGFKANQAPVQVNTATIKTHTDLAANVSLANVAQDLEGDSIFWHVVGNTHGAAKLSADGQVLLFTPEMGYTGQASITVQADDGFAAAAPIALTVNVSGAKLIAIHLTRIAILATGQSKQLQVTGDFEDQEGVQLVGTYAQYISQNTSAATVSVSGLVKGIDNGISIVKVQARGIEGVNVFTVDTDPQTPELDRDGQELHLYPRAVTLALMSQRQLKVSLPDDSAISEAASGTQYFISDSNVADINADGLIHSKTAGTAFITIVHAGSQHTITLVVQPAVTGPAAVQTNGGLAVQDGQSNLVMLPPGSLPAGTRVGIESMSIADVGMALPAPEILNTLAAFKLDLGGQISKLPVQLAIPLTSSAISGLGAGTQVQFWRKGTITDVDGSVHDTWWLVDNGVIGSDGVAHTSSEPFGGVSDGQTYIITESPQVSNDPNNVDSSATSGWDVIWSVASNMAYSLSGAFPGLTSFVSDCMTSIFYADPHKIQQKALRYTAAGAYSAVVPPQAFLRSNVISTFPALGSTSINAPEIGSLEFDPQTMELIVKGVNFIPEGQSANNLELKVCLTPRGSQDIALSESGRSQRGLIYRSFTPVILADGALKITLPEDVALSMHDIWIERRGVGSSNGMPLVNSEKITSGLVEASITTPDWSLVTNSNSIDVFAVTQNVSNRLALLQQITTDENGNTLIMGGRYAEQIAHSTDGSIAYIAGRKGRIYVLDTRTLRIVHTLRVAGSSAPIISLSATDEWLYVCEGSAYGQTGGRLMRIDADMESNTYLTRQQQVRFDASAPYGFQDMAINSGSYLALTAPQTSDSLGIGGVSTAGNIYVLDLAKIQTNGTAPSSAVVTIGAGNLPVSNRGKYPRYISAGTGNAEFLLSSAKDRNAGLTSLKLATDANGYLQQSQPVAKSLFLTPTDDYQWVNARYQQNIQRAAGHVIVSYQGVEYAFVADFNLLFNDVHFNAEEEWGKGKVIGGKLGIIKDPFGKLGEPVYLGATSPIVGGSIDQLVLGEDGTLYANVFLDEATDFGWSMRKSLFTWDATALLKHAIDPSRNQARTVPIDRPDRYSAQYTDTRTVRYDSVYYNNADRPFGFVVGLSSFHSSDNVIDLSDPNLRTKVIETNQVEAPGPVSMETTAQWLNTDESWLRRLGYGIIDGFSGGFFSARDELRKQYNTGEITFREYEQKVLVRALAHGLGMVVSFAVAGPVFGVATKLGGTIAASSAISGVISGQVMEKVIKLILSEKHKQVQAGTITWEQALADTSVLEIELALGAVLGPGQAKKVSQESVVLIKNLFADLSTSLSTTGGKFTLVAGAAAATDAEAALLPKLAKSAKTKLDITSSRLSESLGGATKVMWRGRDLFITPPRQSLTLIQSAQWYRTQYTKIDSWVDKTLPLQQQILQFVKFDNLLLQGAKRGLLDGNNGALLNSFVPTGKQTLKRYKAITEGTGQPQLKKIYEDLRTRDVGALRSFEAEACFAAGTLVHTKEGLKPIEQIQVGDWVLSKHESGEGERDYKRVTKTFVHEDREVISIGVGGKQADGQNYYCRLFVTPEHPIWVRGKGWKEAAKVKAVWPFIHVEVLSDIEPRVIGNYLLFKTTKETHAWVPSMDNREGMESHGTLIDMATLEFTGEHIHYYDQSVPVNYRKRPEHRFTTTVYNIEVEDFHTYFVTKDGIWVHNKNLSTNNSTAGSLLSSGIEGKLFYTKAEMYAYLEKNQISNGYFIIRSGTSGYEAKAISEGELAQVQKWIRHEENAPNRMVAPDGTKYELAIPYYDPLYTGPGSKYRFLAVEGHVDRLTFVDQKLSLVKAGDFAEALQLIYRTALRLKANSQEKMIYQFNPAVNGESVGLRDAKAFFDGIKQGFIEFDAELIGASQKNQLIREIIESGRIILQDAPLSQIVRLETPHAGPGESSLRLSQSDIDALISVAKQVWLDAGALANAFDGLSLSVSDLPTGIAAWTQERAITLDASGAGWGWYLDASPLDGNEFAVADAANAWHVNEADSDNPAASHLDLLTVLIHELGHVVKLSHTAGQTDAMSQYLAPGQRRLLSSDDVAALHPSQYLQTVTGVASSVSGVATYAALIVPSQWQSVHSTLANSNFAQITSSATAPSQWETIGNIVTSPGFVTLGESTSAQAHLAQAFVLSAQDRFLTFTVSGLNLQTNSIEQGGVFTTAPQDAFEVALQNANTGANLLATGADNLGTSRSDALLNLQLASSSLGATLQERAVSGLRHTDNADGSRTYVLDLSGIAAGTAVNLSFDLIGFGLSASQLGSKVNVSDVRLISTPVAVNDAATLAEDGSATLSVQANDLNTDTVGFAPRLVASAQHGQVSVNAAGSFVYTADANFFGSDSFTYQYSNAAGTELSNTATVTLTVTPVNDAPVAADVADFKIYAGLTVEAFTDER